MTTKLTPSQQDLATAIFECGAIKFGAFLFKHHEDQPDALPSPIRINLRTPENPNPGPLTHFIVRKAAMEMEQLIRHQRLSFQAVAGVPNAGLPFATDLRRVMDKTPPLITLGKVIKEGGARRIASVIDRDGLDGGQVLLVDDVVTHAGSKLEAANVLRDAGFTVTDVLVLVDREQGGRELLAEQGCTLGAVFTLTGLLAFYVQSGRITTAQQAQVRAYLRYDAGQLSREAYVQQYP